MKKYIFCIMAAILVITLTQCSNESGESKESPEKFDLNIKFNVIDLVAGGENTINGSTVSLTGSKQYQQDLVHSSTSIIEGRLDDVQSGSYSMELAIRITNTTSGVETIYSGETENVTIQQNKLQNVDLQISDGEETCGLELNIYDNTITPTEPPEPIDEDEFPVPDADKPQITLLPKGDGKYDVYYTFSEEQHNALQLDEWAGSDVGYIYIDCVVLDEYGHVLSSFGSVEAYYEEDGSPVTVEETSMWITECDLMLTDNINYAVDSFCYVADRDYVDLEILYYYGEFSLEYLDHSEPIGPIEL